MKKILGVLTGLLLALALTAQTPDAFNYQAVARDASGNPITDTDISVRASILPGSEVSSAIYSESFSLTTNSFGLFALEVGNGSIIFGDFATIDWASGPYFLKVELVIDDGSSYLVVGTGKLLSVPYALHAKNAENLFSGDYEDLVNSPAWSDSIAESVFSGVYDDLGGTPDWADSIAKYSEGTIIPEGVVESGNLLTYDGNNWVAKDIMMADAGADEPVSIMPPYMAINYCIALQGLYPSRNVAEPFIGVIMAFGFNFAPRGWAACDGQLLPISQNTSLFSLLGTYYGGDGRTTFGLPDLRGRTLIHYGTGPGLTNRSIGEKLGSETITLPIGAMPTHKHIITFE